MEVENATNCPKSRSDSWPANTIEALKTREDNRDMEALTTVVIRNLPRSMVLPDLLGVMQSLNFDEGDFNFLNMQEDKRGGINRGYAFINAISHPVAKRLLETMNGHVWDAGITPAVAEWSKLQGLEANLAVVSDGSASKRRRGRGKKAQTDRRCDNNYNEPATSVTSPFLFL